MARKKSSTHSDPRWTSDVAPAPGDLRMVQDFVNTVGGSGDDRLASPSALADWLRHWGLLGAGVELTAADLERARGARAGVRALVAGNSGRKVDAEAVAALDRASAGTSYHLRFAAGARARYEPQGSGLDAPLGRLLQIVAAEESAERWPQLKFCSDPTCGAAYYDFSSNQSARWCSTRCGNRLSARLSRRRYGK